jgi:hypothetical protein
MIEARVQTVPSAASRSNVGVRTIGWPHAPITSARWSSAITSRMLGGTDAGIAEGAGGVGAGRRVDACRPGFDVG